MEAPSTIAASCTPVGSVRKKEVRKKMVKGSEYAMYAIISPGRVSRRPKFSITAKSGTRARMTGNIMPPANSMKMTRLPGKVKRAMT